MLIEFTGTPATGKTTTAIKLVNELSNSGRDVTLQFPVDKTGMDRLTRLATKAWMCTNVLFTQPAFTLKLFKLLSRYLNTNMVSRLNLLTNGLYVKKLVDKASSTNSVTVLHQGFFQYIYSVGKQSDDAHFETILDTMMPWCKPPVLVVNATATQATIERRLAKRSAREKNRKGHIKSTAEIARSDRLMSALSKRIESSGAHWVQISTDVPEGEHIDVRELTLLCQNI